MAASLEVLKKALHGAEERGTSADKRRARRNLVLSNLLAVDKAVEHAKRWYNVAVSDNSIADACAAAYYWAEKLRALKQHSVAERKYALCMQHARTLSTCDLTPEARWCSAAAAVAVAELACDAQSGASASERQRACESALMAAQKSLDPALLARSKALEKAQRRAGSGAPTQPAAPHMPTQGHRARSAEVIDLTDDVDEKPQRQQTAGTALSSRPLSGGASAGRASRGEQLASRAAWGLPLTPSYAATPPLQKRAPAPFGLAAAMAPPAAKGSHSEQERKRMALSRGGDWGSQRALLLPKAKHARKDARPDARAPAPLSRACINTYLTSARTQPQPAPLQEKSHRPQSIDMDAGQWASLTRQPMLQIDVLPETARAHPSEHAAHADGAGEPCAASLAAGGLDVAHSSGDGMSAEDAAQLKAEELALERTQEDHMCNVCLSVYHRACSLNCGHSFCELCIENLSCAVKKAGKGTLVCPCCRRPVTQQPTPNEQLRRTIEQLYPAHVRTQASVTEPQLREAKLRKGRGERYKRMYALRDKLGSSDYLTLLQAQLDKLDDALILCDCNCVCVPRFDERVSVCARWKPFRVPHACALRGAGDMRPLLCAMCAK